MRFVGNHTKCINSLLRAIFDVLKIFIMAAIFMSKMAIFHLKMAAIMEIFKISKNAYWGGLTVPPDPQLLFDGTLCRSLHPITKYFFLIFHNSTLASLKGSKVT